MPIPLTCDCGRSMRVKDELAGRKIRCPACTTVMVVPKPETPPDTEAEALNLLLEDSDDPPPSSRPDPEDAPRTDAIQQPRPGPRPPQSEPERPEWKWKKKKAPGSIAVRKRKANSGGGLFNNLNFDPRVVCTGLLMMFGAVVWFVVGLIAGWIYFYPPILFVLGLGTVFKGFMGGRD